MGSPRDAEGEAGAKVALANAIPLENKGHPSHRDRRARQRRKPSINPNPIFFRVITKLAKAIASLRALHTQMLRLHPNFRIKSPALFRSSRGGWQRAPSLTDIFECALVGGSLPFPLAQPHSKPLCLGVLKPPRKLLQPHSPKIRARSSTRCPPRQV